MNRRPPSRNSRTHSRNQRQRLRLLVESLESRRLLHGDSIEILAEVPAETHSHSDAMEVYSVIASSDLATHDHNATGDVTVEANAEIPPALSLEIVEDPNGLVAKFSLNHFDLSEEAVDGEHVDGQGHLHLYMDGEKISRWYSDSYLLAELTAPMHTFSADLNSNDHRAYTIDGKSISASVDVYAADFYGPIPLQAFRIGSTLTSQTFSIPGIDAEDATGTAVHTAGDFNGDGIDDVIVAASGGDNGGNTDDGEVYVVFGSDDGLQGTLDLSTLDGTNGFKLIGVASGDQTGASVGGGGDVNDDGFDDIVIGAPGADPDARANAGQAYVVYGSNTFGATFNLSNLNGTNGFRIAGAAAGDDAGRSVAIAQDVNDDGVADVIVGAPLHDSGGSNAGASFVIYGSTSPVSSTLDLGALTQQQGIRIDGGSEGDNLGFSVETAGDVNGDGVNDLVLGAPAGIAESSTSCDPSNTVGLIQCDAAAAPGYTLFAPNASTNTYLVDENGYIVNTWSASDRPGLSATLLDDGSLLRTANTGGTNFQAGGNGGAVEIYDWDGNLTWQYNYSSTDYRTHHDVEMLPNGNILMIAWELRTDAEAIAAGRDPAMINDGHLWADTIIEVQPTGPTSGDIVWKWDVWDHLVQDFDATKDNFGSVANSPELIDINFMRNAGEDWLHFNSIDYNQALDQIVISVHGFSELWIIDHSTTVAEATSHSGGSSGMGGDLIYRWGNPQAYDRGTTADQAFFTQHDARWIEPGYPGEGNLLVFNNGQQRPGGNASSVDELIPPVDANGVYTLSGTDAYGPTSLAWTWSDTPATDFYAQNISGAHRLTNGNTLITNGPAGQFLEVDAAGNEVFEYISPVSNSGVAIQGDTPAQNAVFRATKYAPSFAGFANKDLTPGSTVETGGTSTTTTTTGSGSAYVLFGSANLFTTSVSGLTGADGFELSGVDSGDELGYSVSTAGDVNDDGFDDVIVGSPRAKVDGISVGAAYVVLGKSSAFASEIPAASLDGTVGYRLGGDYESDPILNSLFVNASGTTGYGGALVNFNSVIPDDDYVHVHTSGIPHYATIGPWGQNPNDATDQDVTFYIPRNPVENTGTKSATRLGAIGTWIDGTAIFNWSDGMSFRNEDNWNQIAVIFEADSFDACDAHPPGTGQYHTHGVPACLVDEVGDDGTEHSPILGWSFDGFPIYGSYGYVDGDPNAGIERVESGWTLRDLTTRVDGPPLAPVPLGSFLEDYEFTDSGDLDEYNGRFGPTPEYPDGIYHYYVTIDDAGEAAFPYVIGLEYNGIIAPGNANNGGAAPTLDDAAISVGTAGDANGDGFDDVLVGDPDAYVDGVGVGGSVTLVHGHDGNHDADTHLHTIDETMGMHVDGDMIGDQAGASVGLAGDFDGDAVDDFIVGGPGADTGDVDAGDAIVVTGVVDPNAAPVVVRVVINDGNAQRSSLTSVTVEFDRVVQIDNSISDAFQIENSWTGETVIPLVQITNSTTTSVRLTFDPANPFVDASGSLSNGDYQLTFKADRIRDQEFRLDGNDDGIAGDDGLLDSIDGLFRKYGDHNGDNAIGLTDFAAFRGTFGLDDSQENYLDWFDSNNDQMIGLADFAAFRSAFGT